MSQEIKVSDMVLVPQNVYMTSTTGVNMKLNHEPFYGIVLEVRKHYMDGGSRMGNLLIDHQGLKILVDQEDVFKC
jgi:hypothetical protein